METIIVTGGLEAAANAGVLGQYFPIKYFVPIYDQRTDPTIHDTASTSAFSDTVTSADSVPDGEIIYNVDAIGGAYTLTSDEILVSAGGETVSAGGTDAIISGTTQNDTDNVNLYNGETLSDTISGSAFSLSGDEWSVSDYILSGGTALTPDGLLSAGANMFPIAAYSPIVATGGEVAGLYKARLGKGIGNFKFNKVAFYIQKTDSDGNETSDAPVLFAIAGLDTPVRKDTTNYNSVDVEIDVELRFYADNTISNLFVGNDYWVTVAGTSGTNQKLYFDGDVSIASSGVGFDPSGAKLRLVGSDKNNLMLSYDDIATGDWIYNVDSAGKLTVSAGGDIDYKLQAGHIELEADGYYADITLDSGYSINLEADSTITLSALSTITVDGSQIDIPIDTRVYLGNTAGVDNAFMIFGEGGSSELIIANQQTSSGHITISAAGGNMTLDADQIAIPIDTKVYIGGTPTGSDNAFLIFGEGGSSELIIANQQTSSGHITISAAGGNMTLDADQIAIPIDTKVYIGGTPTGSDNAFLIFGEGGSSELIIANQQTSSGHITISAAGGNMSLDADQIAIPIDTKVYIGGTPTGVDNAFLIFGEGGSSELIIANQQASAGHITISAAGGNMKLDATLVEIPIDTEFYFGSSVSTDSAFIIFGDGGSSELLIANKQTSSGDITISAAGGTMTMDAGSDGVEIKAGTVSITGGTIFETTTYNTPGAFTNLDVSNTSILQIDTSSGNVTAGGFANGVLGQRLYIHKSTGDANYLVIEDANGGATEIIYTPGNTDIAIGGSTNEFGGKTLICLGNAWAVLDT